jgi:hypothetical protein
MAPGVRRARAPGRQYAARRVQGLLSADAAELSLDLAGAYPPEAGIRSWRRGSAWTAPVQAAVVQAAAESSARTHGI